jgi:transposase
MSRAVAVRTRKDSTKRRVLYLAFELGRTQWKLGFTTGMGQRPRERAIQSGDLATVDREIERARRRFQLPAEADVLSCYEAGREAFWLHRFMEAIGHTNYVIDSSSLEVPQRAKRVKTDRIDLRGLLRMLIRFASGEAEVWSVVNVPSPEAEDVRHLHRELLAARRDRTRINNRIKGLMATQGIELELKPGFPDVLERALLWDGLPIPDTLRGRLKREWERLLWQKQQVRILEAERNRLFRESTDPAIDQVRALYALCGIGIESAWVFVMEFFAWRAFRNRRQVAGLAGLTPTPFQSGTSTREQGVAKAGNRIVRWMAIEIAWSWLRHHPESELSRWYNRKFGAGSSRIRRIGVVALARRLLIELWRYLETGALPDGALTKS